MNSKHRSIFQVSPPRSGWAMLAALAAALMLAIAPVALADDGELTGDARAEGDIASFTPGWSGLMVGHVSPQVLAQVNVAKGRGLAVLDVVERGPADRAGIQPHDILLKVDGKAVTADVPRFKTMMLTMPVDRVVRFELLRKGKRLEYDVALAAPPDADKARYRLSDRAVSVGKRISPNKVYKLGPRGLEEVPVSSTTFQKLPIEVRQSLLKRIAAREPDHPLLKLASRLDGQKISFEMKVDGRVSLSRDRLGEDGSRQIITRHYNSLDAFQKASPQAYEALKLERLRKTYARSLAFVVAEEEARADAAQGDDAPTTQPRDSAAGRGQPDSRPKAEKQDGRGLITYEIRILRDGAIEVQISTRGAKPPPVRFKDEAELKAKAPRWYERYKMLREGVE